MNKIGVIAGILGIIGNIYVFRGYGLELYLWISLIGWPVAYILASIRRK